MYLVLQFTIIVYDEICFTGTYIKVSDRVHNKEKNNERTFVRMGVALNSFCLRLLGGIFIHIHTCAHGGFQSLFLTASAKTSASVASGTR